MTTHVTRQHATDAGEFDRLAVLTIQGGGVYGLNMLGQLAAVIDHGGITPLAYAGTSAGAVVAALSWAGYSPKEIRNLFVDLAVDAPPSGCRHAAHGVSTIIDLLGPLEAGESRFSYADFRRLTESIQGFADAVGATLDPSLQKRRMRASLPKLMLNAFTRRNLYWLFFLVLPVGFAVIWCLGLIWYLALVITSLAVVFGCALGFWLATTSPALHGLGKRGFFSGDHFERFIDKCLKNSPRFRQYAADLGDSPLTFGWVDELVEERDDPTLEGIVPLILTATNLTTRELILIDSVDSRFQQLSVARAVRASAGFPVFFRPVELSCPGEGGWYVDGGMISNFPAWVFTRELRSRMVRSGRYHDLATRPWLNIGLRVVSDRPGSAPPDDRPSEFVRSLLDLARGQVRNELEKALAARLPRAISIMQPTSETNAPPKLLDVDQLTDDKIRAMFSRGEEFSKEELQRYSFALPAGTEASRIDRALARVVEEALGLFSLKDNRALKFRANVFVPRAEKLVLVYAHGMGDDEDQHLEFDYNAGLTGFCFLNRRPFLCNLRYTRQWAMNEAQSRDSLLLGMNRDQHLQVREDRSWLASVPIFDPMDCWFLESDAPRMEKDPEAMSLWTDWPGTLDGAVFGVLNLDCEMPYEAFGLSEDPEGSLTDPRISSIFNSLQACSFEIGRMFSQAFARKIQA